MRTFVAAKIHHLHVTQAELNYIGSVTIDANLMEEVGIAPFEQVHIVNLANGERWITYALPGEAGVFSLNGGGARLGRPGDCCVVMTYETASEFHGAQVIRCNADNQIIERFIYPLQTAREDAPGALHETTARP